MQESAQVARIEGTRAAPLLTRVIAREDLPLYAVSALVLEKKGKGKFEISQTDVQHGDDGEPLDDANLRIVLSTESDVTLFDQVIAQAHLTKGRLVAQDDYDPEDVGTFMQLEMESDAWVDFAQKNGAHDTSGMEEQDANRWVPLNPTSSGE